MDFRVAPEAESDLDEIWYFLATQSSNIDIADRVIDSITARFALGRPSLAFVATLISAPPCVFVSGYPRVGWWAIGVLASNLIGAFALRFEWGRYSVSFWIPFMLLVGWLMAVVLGQ